MEVYFYCNYTNSYRGFYPAKLCADGLREVNLLNSQDRGELLAERFFSYESFRILWLELPEKDTSFINPVTEKSFLGIGGLEGTISDKKGYINMAFVADKDEKDITESLARGILHNLKEFSARVADALYIEGKGIYKLDTEKFTSIIDDTVNAEVESFPFSIKAKNTSLRDMLRFAVYIGSWENAACILEPDWLWKIRPKQAISEKDFKEHINL